MTNVLALPVGAELVGDFRIERVLGAGGFGITYLAEETALARLVTIKEYFPTDFAARGSGSTAVPRDGDSREDFQWGLDRFIDEAQTLARFDHPNIVKVYRYFRANDTAYMVLHFEEGQSLKAWLKSLGRFPRQRELDTIVKPLLEALEVIHGADFLHRDIAPDNIIVRRDGSPVLIDFGSARGDIARHSRTVSALVKPGYSPYEQYAENGVRQGPWTDIYALGATLYHAITGKRPPDAPSRVVKDELIAARSAALASYRAGFLGAIDRSLMLDTERRPQSIAAWRGELLAPDAAKPGWLKRTLRPIAASESGVADNARAVADPPGGAPPPPDVPGAKGGLLDYIERMKDKAAGSTGWPRLSGAEPAGGDGMAGGIAGRASSDGADSSRTKVVSGEVKSRWRWAAVASDADAVDRRVSVPKQQALPVPVRRTPPRPRPMPGRARHWRSLAGKLLIGAGIAGVAITMQDRVANTKISIPHLPGLASLSDMSQFVTGSLVGQRLPSSLLGHKGGTASVAFSSDGRSIVTVGADGTLKVWRASSGALARTITLDDGPATSLALNGRRALTGHGDGAVAMWDVDTGRQLGRFKRNEANIWGLAFAGDPNRFVASSHDWSVAIWDARKAASPLAVFEAHENAVQAVAYSSRGPYIATGGADKTVKLWRLSDLSLIRTYRGHREYVTALAFSPDGRFLAAAAMDGRIRVWSTSSRSLYRMNSEHEGRVSGLAFSPGGDAIASTGEDGSVQFWRFRRSRSATDLVEDGPAGRALAFSPDGRRVAVARVSGAVRLWDAAVPGTKRKR